MTEFDGSKQSAKISRFKCFGMFMLGAWAAMLVFDLVVMFFFELPKPGFGDGWAPVILWLLRFAVSIKAGTDVERWYIQRRVRLHHEATRVGRNHEHRS
jgi:hypothetical protein